MNGQKYAWGMHEAESVITHFSYTGFTRTLPVVGFGILSRGRKINKINGHTLYHKDAKVRAHRHVTDGLTYKLKETRVAQKMKQN